MAISKNLWTNGMRKRLAGAVFYQRGGETNVRELAPKVSNPRTPAQMYQRARLSNLVHFYQANLDWMKKGAFETKKEKQSDYNKFVSVNSAAAPVFLTKQLSESGAAIIDRYMVTQGSLPGITTALSADGNNIVSNLYIDTTILTGTLSVATTTISQLTEALMAANNILKVGDQLSLIVNFQRISANSVPFIINQHFEVILSLTDGRTLAEIGWPTAFVSVAQGDNTSLAYAVNGDMIGVAFILSRQVGGKTMVSTQSLVLSTEQSSFLAGFRTAAAEAAYFESYKTGDEYFLDGGYQNDSSNGGVAQVALLVEVNGNVPGGYDWTLAANTQVTLKFGSDAPEKPASGTAVTFTRNGGATVAIDAANVQVAGNTWTIPGSAITSQIANIVKVEVNTANGRTTGVSWVYNPNQGSLGE